MWHAQRLFICNATTHICDTWYIGTACAQHVQQHWLIPDTTKLIHMWHMCNNPHSYVWHAQHLFIHNSTTHLCDTCATVCATTLIYTWCHNTYSNVTYVHQRWFISDTRIQMCDMTHSHVRHDSFICVTWLIHMLWHDSFICATWLIHKCDMTHSYVRHDSFICVTWLILMCDMTHPHVWHDSFICTTWLIQKCDMSRWNVWHGLFICVTWLIHVCDMTHSYAWHDSFICVTWLIHMCDMTHSYVWHNSFICVT